MQKGVVVAKFGIILPLDWKRYEKTANNLSLWSVSWILFETDISQTQVMCYCLSQIT